MPTRCPKCSTVLTVRRRGDVDDASCPVCVEVRRAELRELQRDTLRELATAAHRQGEEHVAAALHAGSLALDRDARNLRRVIAVTRRSLDPYRRRKGRA